jgi:hypothetical protein
MEQRVGEEYKGLESESKNQHTSASSTDLTKRTSKQQAVEEEYLKLAIIIGKWFIERELGEHNGRQY